MKLDPDVIRDLLPLYVAGEASPATRLLVERHLSEDPSLARLAREMTAGDSALASAGLGVAPAADGESRALQATRRLLRTRSLLLGLALAATLLPLSFSFGPEGLDFLMLSASPRLASMFWAAGAALWIAYWRVSRRLRVTGL